MKKKGFIIAGVILIVAAIAAAVGIYGLGAGKSDSIPVVALDGECLNDYTNWNDKSTYYPATLTFTDGSKTFTMDIEIKPQGTSSLHAPKKNFTDRKSVV